ncbi:biotin-dependent carboxyltransferase family protein [Phytohabitans sp. ZYX-F-186]|uniref:Biotin-dependent carboxyltransferase family protein n=1 Tax=Phytohabitans maris TaxID=3071409 RepID=A0ABU0ZTL4_9ACTN|nr:biotin-dependent carboxyltransferase family protein [Phytohabitans sp. ZYX-F-186]MDQ7910298.1 biotin-dependent carboxyltransferase family protein [Phytohabitans sp. ZYX-F-186]
MIEVLSAGPLTTVQDLGRPGYAHLGVPRAGALDGPALRLANRLVGNPPDAAGLEVTAGGCVLRLVSAGTVALTGAHAPLSVNGRPVGLGLPVPVRAGAVVRVGRAVHGVRSYLAVGGGIAVEPVLGSRSTDTLSGLGPAPLRDGDALPVGVAGEPSTVDFVPWQPPPASLRLRITLGPRADWFTPEAVAALLGTAYTVSPVSNRVGARLSGAALTRAEAAELPSEGVVLGAIQVPASGQPLIFLADHPTTGGYPVIGVVDDVTPLAQAVPGTTVNFHGSQR